MVRPFRNEVTVVCAGEQFTLAIDISIIDAIEDEFDLPFDALMAQFKEGTRVGKAARLLRGLLSRHHPDLTLDDAGGLLMEDSEPFALAMQRLFEKSSPEPAQSEGENPPKARRGTGGGSSSNGAQRASRRANSGSKRLEPSS
jgi:hypothetical protein